MNRRNPLTHTSTTAQRGCRRGLSTVDLMIVLTILGSLMVVIGVGAVDAMERNRLKDTTLRLHQVSHTIQLYRHDAARLPSDLGALTQATDARPAYIAPEDLRDAWKRALRYEREGDRFLLRSCGPDGAPGSDDDIVLEGER